VRRSDRHIDALLGQGELSGPEADRILQAVLARRSRRSWRRWFTLGAGLTLAAAAAVVLVVAPHHDGFAPRGATVAGAAVEVACLGHSLAACPRGATLLFALRGGSPGGYLTAWADPAGPGQRVWYFSADQETPLLQASESTTQALSRGVRIGPEHLAGDYQLHVVLSEQPLPQALVAAPPGVRARAQLSLTITETAAP
jgi:hypothetical protein